MKNSIEILERDNRYYRQALALRYELFFEIHDLSKDVLNDELEGYSTHLGLISNGDLVAYGRLSCLGDGVFKISQMVVSTEFQGLGCGSQVLTELIKLASENGAKRLILNARVSAVPFYECNGFERVGKIYPSSLTGIPHIRMEQQLFA